MKKIVLFAVIFATASVFEACNDGSNGDRAKGGRPDTVGAGQNSGVGSGKDSTNGLKDTVQHK